MKCHWKELSVSERRRDVSDERKQTSMIEDEKNFHSRRKDARGDRRN